MNTIYTMYASRSCVDAYPIKLMLRIEAYGA